jgi:hypothetical protein
MAIAPARSRRARRRQTPESGQAGPMHDDDPKENGGRDWGVTKVISTSMIS